VVPLVIAVGGPGAEMRAGRLGHGGLSAGNAWGVTLFGVFLTPVFYYVISVVRGKRKQKGGHADPPHPAPATGPGRQTARDRGKELAGAIRDTWRRTGERMGTDQPP